MNVISMKTAVLLAIACAIPLMQDTEGKSGDDGLFKAPVRLKAGDKWLGENRLYPSPAVHDLDGDGLPDIVVGDLRGIVTVATRSPVGEKAIGSGRMTDREAEDLQKRYRTALNGYTYLVREDNL